MPTYGFDTHTHTLARQAWLTASEIATVTCQNSTDLRFRVQVFSEGLNFMVHGAGLLAQTSEFSIQGCEGSRFLVYSKLKGFCHHRPSPEGPQLRDQGEALWRAQPLSWIAAAWMAKAHARRAGSRMSCASATWSGLLLKLRGQE